MGYGVVFGGGGAKGAYEIGVWKALRELEIPIDVVVGASVGALNGAIMTQGDYDIAIKLWNNLSMTDIIRFEQNIESNKSSKPSLSSMARLIRSSIANGGMDVTPLKELLNEVIDEKKIRESVIDFGIVTFSLTDFKAVKLFKKDIPEGKLVEYLLASSCFPTFRPQVIDDKRFIDGGVYDNIPISMVLEKCDSIIAIDVSGPGWTRRTDTGIHQLINIKNSEYLGGTLRFDGEASTTNIECGYLDTLKAFEKIRGRKYYFSIETNIETDCKEYLEDHEIEMLYRFFESGAISYCEEGSVLLESQKKKLSGYNYELLKNRVLKLIREYSDQELNRGNMFMGMLEICAEVIGIERKQIYHVGELVEKILERYLEYKGKRTQQIKPTIGYLVRNMEKAPATIVNAADLVGKDVVFGNVQDHIGSKEQARKRIAIGLAKPKLIIANLFVTILHLRKTQSTVEKF